MNSVIALILFLVFVFGSIGMTEPMPPPFEAPFSLIENYPIARVFVNGEGPFTMVLDTGSTTTYLDREVAVRLNLSLSGHGRTIHLEGQNETARKTELAKVQLGALSAENVEAYVWRWTSEEKTVGGVEIQGILGNTFFSKWIVQFDYANERIRFCDPNGGWVPKGRGIQFRGDLSIDKVTLNGKTFKAQVDTGSQWTFSIPPRPAKGLKLEPITPGVPVAFLDSAAIGTTTIDGASALLIARGKGESISVGNALLKRFAFTVDYIRKMMFLDPPGNSSDFCRL